jgi:hypothetical protein
MMFDKCRFPSSIATATDSMIAVQRNDAFHRALDVACTELSCSLQKGNLMAQMSGKVHPFFSTKTKAFHLNAKDASGC